MEGEGEPEPRSGHGVNLGDQLRGRAGSAEGAPAGGRAGRLHGAGPGLAGGCRSGDGPRLLGPSSARRASGRRAVRKACVVGPKKQLLSQTSSVELEGWRLWTPKGSSFSLVSSLASLSRCSLASLFDDLNGGGVALVARGQCCSDRE